MFSNLKWNAINTHANPIILRYMTLTTIFLHIINIKIIISLNLYLGLKCHPFKSHLWDLRVFWEIIICNLLLPLPPCSMFSLYPSPSSHFFTPPGSSPPQSCLVVGEIWCLLEDCAVIKMQSCTSLSLYNQPFLRSASYLISPCEMMMMTMKAFLTWKTRT